MTSLLERMRLSLRHGHRYNIRTKMGERRATFFHSDSPHFVSEHYSISLDEILAIQEADRPGAAWNSTNNYRDFSNPCAEIIF